MKEKWGPVLASVLASSIFMVPYANAQTPTPQTPQAASSIQLAPQYAPGQLEQMLAPIALYPDALVAQILMAATYPLEVVEADRWLQDPEHAALAGDQLVAALESQPWDPSIKSLLPFPRVLQMMDGNLEWVEQLGDAFLANQPAVMDAIQHLRQQAQAAGRLNTTPQQVVTTAGTAIMIEPASSETVYVPVYDPAVVYGLWPYPGFEPDYFPGYFDGVIVGGFGFGWWGVTLVAPLWGWDRWDWGRHRIDIDRGRYTPLNDNRPPNGDTWAHDPSHRRGVPYLNPNLRNRFAGNAGIANENQELRGYAPNDGARYRANSSGNVPSGETRRQPSQLLTIPSMRNDPPTFESYGNGSAARAQAARGNFSRMSSTPSYMRQTPASHSAPSRQGRSSR